MTEVARKRVDPALSAFVYNSTGLELQLNDLINFSKTFIPAKAWSSTAISLKATAGLRELPVDHQISLISYGREFLQKSGYFFRDDDTRIITGEEEALFDFLGTLVAFQTTLENNTIGTADLGGSSQQIAFAHQNFANFASLCTANMSLELGNEFLSCDPQWQLTLPKTETAQKYPPHINIYAQSFRQMGIIAAMDEMISSAVIKHEAADSEDGTRAVKALAVPLNATPPSCLHPIDSHPISPHPIKRTSHDHENIAADSTTTATTTESCLYDSPNFAASPPSRDVLVHPCLPRGTFPPDSRFPSYELHGRGDFHSCVEEIRRVLLPRVTEATDVTCLHRLRPKTIVGIDSFPKVLQMLNLTKESVAPAEIQAAAEVVCTRSWEDLLSDFPPHTPSYRAHRACFGGSFIFVMLVDVFGLDPLDATAFKPIESRGSHELSWAIGAALQTAMGFSYRKWNASGELGA